MITFEKSVTKIILENVMIRFQMNNCKTDKLEVFQRYQGTGVRTLSPKTLRPRTLRPKRALRPNVNYAQGNYDNVISYAHIPLVP